MSTPASQLGAIVGESKAESFMRKAAQSPHRDDICCIFVHAGAGYHSHANERIHLEACNDAAQVAMLILRNGGSALDAAEMAVKILEDREVTNAGYGSNLAMDGVVECDASIVDHYGRSGAVGAVFKVRNPVCLARLVLNHTIQPLTLRRVPPNLLVAQGALDFAGEVGVPELPHDALVSPAAKERWLRWKSDLKQAERKARKSGAHRSCWKVGTPASAAEDEEHERLRREHTKNMLHGHLDLIRPLTPMHSEDSLYYIDKTSPTPSEPSGPGSDSSMETSASDDRMTLSNSTTTEQPRVHALYLSPAIEEASRSAFINSTQKVPTLNRFQDSRLKRGAPVSGAAEDSLMLDAGGSASLGNHLFGDGSGAESDLASSATATRPFDAAMNSSRLVAPRSAAIPDSTMGDSPLPHQPTTAPEPQAREEDHITDTVGAIAVDGWGNIACAASSGGIGMKYRGRVGPAALVGVGTAVIPINPDDPERTCVATVTSGTGEHMATTMAATVCAERLYQSVKKRKGGEYVEVTEDEALKSMIENDFMGHPSVTHSNSAGAIGILGVKKTRQGIMIYYGHNTDSFAMASMHSDEEVPWCAMSRSNGNGQIAQGGRMMRYQRKKKTKTNPLSRQQFA